MYFITFFIMRKFELLGSLLRIKDPDPVFYPDPDQGDRKRPDSDPQHC